MTTGDAHDDKRGEADILTDGSLRRLSANCFGEETEWSRATEYETLLALQLF